MAKRVKDGIELSRGNIRVVIPIEKAREGLAQVKKDLATEKGWKSAAVDPSAPITDPANHSVHHRYAEPWRPSMTENQMRSIARKRTTPDMRTYQVVDGQLTSPDIRSTEDFFLSWGVSSMPLSGRTVFAVVLIAIIVVLLVIDVWERLKKK